MWGEPAGAVQSDGQAAVNTAPPPLVRRPLGQSQVSMRLSEGEARHRQFRSNFTLFVELLEPRGSQVH